MKRSRKSRREHTPRQGKRRDELVVGSKGLIYAIHMLKCCNDLLVRKDNLHETTKNAILESFLLHARELLDFFCPTRISAGDPDTVLAADFFDPKNWSNPNPLTYLTQNRQRLNKRIAHLAYSRGDLEEGWRIDLIYTELSESVRKFSDAVDKTKLALEIEQLEIRDDNSTGLTCGTHTSVTTVIKARGHSG